MEQGSITADDETRAVLSPDHLARAFGISGWFAETPQGPVFQPLARL